MRSEPREDEYVGEHYRGFILLTCVCSVFITDVCVWFVCAYTSIVCEILRAERKNDEQRGKASEVCAGVLEGGISCRCKRRVCSEERSHSCPIDV